MLGGMNYDLLHPIARGQFLALANDLGEAYGAGRTRTLFRAFEGYRDPGRQLLVYRDGKSRARPWASAHQYGLAVDFVPYDNGRWSWDKTHDWDFLRRAAATRGLENAIEWDRCHVQHPIFATIEEQLRPRISGVEA